MLDSTLTQERLKQLLSYNPDTGEFTRRTTTRRGRWVAGQTAGCVNKCGYSVIWIDGVLYTAHRLAWLYTNGAWPKGEIDHVNGRRADNRIVNLRDVTRQQNNANQGKIKNNSSGIKGVSWDKTKNKWSAKIGVDGKTVNLGRFASVADAAAAYQRAAEEVYGEFARAK
jgi:hypothetical protein